MLNTSKLIWASVLGVSLLFQLSGCGLSGSSSFKNRPRTLLTDSVPQPQPRRAPSANSNGPVNLNGQWRLGFQVENRTLSSTLNLSQHGESFQGEGIDDQTKRHFAVEGGAIKGAQVTFFKRYDGNDMQPVEHKGQFSILNDEGANVHGPYMSGDYSTSYHGKALSGAWEAAMVPPEKAVSLSAPAPEPEAQQVSQPVAQAQPGKSPDLSGKWTVGYEANFKTIHSVMYLEQDGGKVAGHGVDLDTKEKFFIAKGWYHFPHLTIIRTYVKGKGAKANRNITFKADVSFINDRDYQGPYLNGKTQGGGTWEAEKIK
jgi:hypothetical protein